MVAALLVVVDRLDALREDVAPQRFVGLHDPHRTGAVGNIELRDRIGAEDVIDLTGLDVDQVAAISLLAVHHARHPRTNLHLIAFDKALRTRALPPTDDAPARSLRPLLDATPR